MAYHDIGYACLEKLLGMGAEVAAVVTHADNPGENIWFRPVRDLALENVIPVYQPEKVNDPRMVAALRAIAPDIIFSFYFRQLLKEDILDIPRIGAFNLHGSLLPRYRGRCPVNWVLVNGETETGVTLHRMELKPDKGGIVAQKAVAIDSGDTAFTLFRKLTGAAVELISEVYPLMRAGEFPEIEQDHAGSSYFGGRRPVDGLIDWNRGAVEIYNLIRAVTHPYPGAFTRRDGRTLFIWWGTPTERGGETGAKPGEVLDRDGLCVAAGKGVIEVARAQWEGRPEMEGKTLREDLGLSPGTLLG